MPAHKKILDPILHARHLGFQRARCQAKFRNEPWELTEEHWNMLWTRDRWVRRGRSNGDLCLSLIDDEGGWSLNNVAIITRDAQLKIKGYRHNNKPYEHLYKDAEWAPQ